MGLELPPTPARAKLAKEIALVPSRHREDAVQEAWLAHLSGECPLAAVYRFRNREAKYDANLSIETDDGVDFVREDDGRVVELIRNLTETPAPRQSKSKRPSQHSRKLAG